MKDLAGGVARVTAAFLAFLRLEPASGILLFAAAVLAMALANSPWAPLYESLMRVPVAVHLGPLDFDKSLIEVINDGLMVLFFCTIGMEVKIEMLVGALADRRRAALPAAAAVGGMVVPALIYAALNARNPAALHGWAIPTATDIAFSLGLLTLAGPRVPVGLKVFLMALAIYDDLGAIMIIAMFYSHGLDLGVLVIALVALGVLGVLNVAGVQRLAPYLVTGFVLWFAVLESGVHATLAGVALGLFIPLGRDGTQVEEGSPIRRALDTLHPWVAFGILPLFAFMNAGVPVGAFSLAAVLSPIPVGVAAGLFFGKQVGVFGFTWLALRAAGARLPDGVTMSQIYGVALLCGVGFTMSLFIGTLALTGEHQQLAHLGVLAGSAAAGVAGFAWLRLALR